MPYNYVYHLQPSHWLSATWFSSVRPPACKNHRCYLAWTWFHLKVKSGFHLPAPCQDMTHWQSIFTVMWTAFTMTHFGLLCFGDFSIPKNFWFDLTGNIYIRDITTHFQASFLHSIAIRLNASKPDPFFKGVTVIIGCTCTLICGVCMV